MELKSGDRIVVSGNPFKVKGIDKRWHVICAADRWGKTHEFFLSDISHIERAACGLVPKMQWNQGPKALNRLSASQGG